MKKEGSVPTMRDVAREAGVALGTVSNVVNGKPVSGSLKIRVEDAIKKLNYQIDSYAQGLKAGRTHTVAFMIPDMQDPFWASLASHVNRSLLKRKHRMLLYTTDYDSEKEREYVVMARQGKVDGIIGFACNPGLAVEEGMPFVSIDCCMGAGIPCVSSDNFGGGRLAAGKLADLGCRNVACLCAESSFGSEMGKRKAGFADGCLSRRIAYEMKSLGEGESYEGVGDFLSAHISEGKLAFDGIFCMTDSLAYFAVKTLRKLGQKVPEDVQVIGFGGLQLFWDGNYLCSTIIQPIPEIAEVCVELVLQEDRVTKPLLVCLPVTYGYGGTTLDCP